MKIEELKRTTVFKLIKEHYGDRKAQRSGVPLMNHIIEGAKILIEIGASDEAMEAFCLHPIVQDDKDFKEFMKSIFPNQLLGRTLALAVEYRNVANSYLSKDYKSKYDNFVKLSPIKDVNDMLIADKVQNRKDFEIYHKGSHQRSVELTQYFKNWLRYLGINENKYNKLIEAIQDVEKI